MEIAGSGGIRDLPPSKRFKYVASQLGSTPCMPLPVKKRVLAPPPEAAPVSACLPVKKRAIVAAPPPEDSVPVRLPAKKRTYPPPMDAAAPAACFPAKKPACAAQPRDAGAMPCVPAKKRVHEPPPSETVVRPCVPAKKRAQEPPPSETVARPCFPAKKRVHDPPPSEKVARPCVPAKKRADDPPPSEKVARPCVPAKKRADEPPPSETVARPCVPAKKRVHEPPPSEKVARPCVPAKKRADEPPPSDTVARPCVPAKNGVHEPLPPEKAVGSRPVCLPSNKRVMPPSPLVGPGAARVGGFKEVKPQASNNRAAAASAAVTTTKINPRVATSARVDELKKPKKPINPEETKEHAPVKPIKPRSPSKVKDLDRKACKAVHGKQFDTEAEARKRAEEAAEAKEAAPKAESRDGAEAVAREPENQAVEEDDGVLCAVCGSTDGDPSDPIVFCDGCDLMVHATCYGNPLAQAIPDGDWFCSPCAAEKSSPAAAARPSCCLCPASGGAMKRTTDGRWAHIACALLVPEVFFRDPDGRDGVDCSGVPAHRFAMECYICESTGGCALECSQPKCSLGFHVSCGLDGGLCIEYREAKGGAIVAGFCREHTELWEKQQLTGKYKIVARGQE